MTNAGFYGKVPDVEPNDLKLCVEALTNKTAMHVERWRYYDGDHPVNSFNPHQETTINNGVVFKKNWCQVIIDSKRARLRVQTWNHKDKTILTALTDIWKQTLKKTAARIHLSVLTTGEAYLIVWRDKNDEKKPRAYYHDPTQAHIIYDEDDPDKPRVACKTWAGRIGESKAYFLNLYYPERIEHYVAMTTQSPSWGAYQPYGVQIDAERITHPQEQGFSEQNDYGVIPVFHFQLDQRVCTGELTMGVLSLQDALNMLLNDMMVSSEFSAFNQRWAITNAETGSKLPSGPGTTAMFTPSAQGDQPVSVGAWAATPPDNYLKSMTDLSNGMAVLSATPKHFFEGQVGTPSGEALAAMEAPLVARVEDYQEILCDPWQHAAAFCMQIAGQDVLAQDIECIWVNPHTVQSMSRAQTRLTNTQAGIPITNQLRDEGWTEDDLDQLHEDMNVESSMGAAEVPAVGAFPPNIPENKRVAASAKAKDVLAARAEPDMAKVMQNTVDKGVDAMTKSGALGKIMEKHKGMKAGQ